MCAPAEGKTQGAIYKGFLEYARNFKNMKAKDQATIDKEMEDFHPTETLKELSETLNNVRNEIDEVLDPILVVQAENDEMINPQSEIIYMRMSTQMKRHQMVCKFRTCHYNR